MVVDELCQELNYDDRGVKNDDELWFCNDNQDRNNGGNYDVII